MADVAKLVRGLTLEEKALLTAGGGPFSTAPVDRLGIPRLRVTDGPGGARAESYPGLGGASSTCIPCGTAIGASWNPDLAERLGRVVGREALDRSCRGLLAPTVNLHRSPLAGRNFECFSEDPLLTGKVAAGYVRGVQSQGVIATVKHYVANDAEEQRTTMNSVVDERALRELYLLPFEIAVKEAGALGIMSSYNRLNGSWIAEQRELLIDILRGEWGFQGLVMTDWFAYVDTLNSLAAGLDLEMPGPGRAFGPALIEAVQSGQVAESDLDAAVTRILTAFDLIGGLDEPERPLNPQPYQDEDKVLLREAGAETIVLLSNNGLLPFAPNSVRSLAVIGELAARPRIMGGGSASVTAHTYDRPVEAFQQAFGDGVSVTYERAVNVDRRPTIVGPAVLRAADGFAFQRWEGTGFEGDPADEFAISTLAMKVHPIMAEWGIRPWSARARGTVVPEEGGVFQLGLTQVGRARVFIDGQLVIDGFGEDAIPSGTHTFGVPDVQMLTEVTLRQGVPTEFLVEFVKHGDGVGAFSVGFRTTNDEELFERAVAAAQAADTAVVVVGTTEEWESEGIDRSTLALPGRQAELIERVSAVNPRTVVVVNAGAPVDMAWADGVAAVLQCWFGGQEMAHAVADVLLGLAEPGGRMPTTVPMRLEDTPSYPTFPGQFHENRYGEGLFIGYRWHEMRKIEPRFAFGHGLSYTTFEIGEPTLSAATFRCGEQLRIVVPVTNTGTRAGSEVIQCYVAPGAPSAIRPRKELKAFGKVFLEPGATAEVDLILDDRAFAYWAPGGTRTRMIDRYPYVAMHLPPEGDTSEWRVDPGPYQLHIGRSTADIAHTVAVAVDATSP